MKQRNQPITSDKKAPPVCSVCPLGADDCIHLRELMALREQNRELSELVRTDPLTGLYNFRYLMQSLELEMERTRRSGLPTTLIMLDLDHFKQVNDTWGHDTGNEALIQTALLISQMVRRLDIPCRYGGEEFAIILPSTDLLVGIQVAERIRNIVATTPLTVGKQSIQLSASLGVDELTIAQYDTVETFIKRTDQYLYQAKTEGRNCVRHATVERMKSVANVSQAERDALFGRYDD